MSTKTTPHPAGANLKFRSAQSFDKPLGESEHFLCVASLGSIVPGWVLITPKRPVINFSRLNGRERKDLRQFLAHVSDSVRSHFGEISVFEHGAVGRDSLTGCGVDQAHLHVVPTNVEQIRAQTTDQTWNACNGKLPFEVGATDREYLWFGADQLSFIAFPPAPVSQYFRRAIAAIEKKPTRWNYNSHPFYEHIRETQNALLDGNGATELRAA